MADGKNIVCDSALALLNELAVELNAAGTSNNKHINKLE